MFREVGNTKFSQMLVQLNEEGTNNLRGAKLEIIIGILTRLLSVIKLLLYIQFSQIGNINRELHQVKFSLQRLVIGS